MGSDSTTTAVLADPNGFENSSVGVFSPMVQAAELEFQATLQLLLERARFLTAASAVAIALQEEGQLVYAASAGDCAPEAGTTVDAGKESIRKCLEQRTPARSTSGDAGAFSTMTVPIIDDGAVGGFFELLGHSEFQEQDAEAINRLAEMVSTAIMNRTAALEAEKRLLERVGEFSRAAVVSLWHAPQSASNPQQKTPEVRIATAEVRKCISCGFPVSKGRRLCVECDQKMGPANTPAEIFSISHHEQSWIRVHGYTIASALVTAAAVAIILWLR